MLYDNGTQRADTTQIRQLIVLCAEDDKEIAAALKNYLQHLGHHVECVSDGESALERVKKEPSFFDLIVTDHNMPHRSGLWLVENLRQTLFSGKLILHSSTLEAADTLAYRLLGVDYIFEKPRETIALLDTILNLGKKSPRIREVSERSPHTRI